MSLPHAQTRAAEQRVVDALRQLTGREPRWSGGQYVALCPAHDDRNPSLAVRWDNGVVLLNCFAGCTGSGRTTDPTPVLDALGLTLADLWDEPKPKGGKDHPPQRRSKPQERKQRPRVTQLNPVALQQQPDTISKPGKNDKGEPVGPWRDLCWHLYTSPEDPDTISWAVIRVQQDRESGYDKEFLPVHFEDGRSSGKFKTKDGVWHSLPHGWITKRPEVRHQDLYRAPAVRAAKAAGETGPVYVTEGESDADTATFAGALAVTAGGATATWHEHYTTLLANMDVVVVLDRDDEGIRRGEKLGRLLTGAARSIRFVQPAGDGNKDLSDHLAAGYTVDQLREIDLALATPQAGTFGSSTDDSDEPEKPNQLPNEYLVRQGQLVERTWKDGDAVYKTVLGCVAWVARVSEEDDGDDATRYTKPTRDVSFVIERRTDDGQPVRHETRIDHEKIIKGTWIHEWPYPDTIIGRSRRAADRALDALYTAIPSPTHRSPVYTATGWRRTDTGWIYVHGGGAIGHGGSLDVDVDVDAILKRTAMPDPTSDATQLRRAYLEGTAALMELPARIAGPLEGFVFRSMIGGPQNMVLHEHGPKGALKTAVSRLFLQHFVPGLRYPQVKEMAAGATSASSVKGMQRLLGLGKDLPVEIDDFAVDRGGAAEAQTRLAELARQAYNGSIQVKADRVARKTVTELPPRCSLITSGEITAGGSAETRCFNVRFEPGEISVEQIVELEKTTRCDSRSLLGASFLRWCAQHYDELVTWIPDLTSVYNAAWRASVSDLPHEDGVLGRLSEAAAGYTVGLTLELTWLTDTGVITEQEAQHKWDYAIGGIRTAARELGVDSTDEAVKLVGWAQEALVTKAAHLTGPSGGPPVIPGDENAPARYGWSPQFKSSVFDSDNAVTWHPNGPAIGHFPRHDPQRVYLLPSATIDVARKVAARTETRWTESRSGFSSALDRRGWIRTTLEKGRKVRTPNREVDGGSHRVWDVERRILDGHFHDGDDTGYTESSAPAPLDPRLATVPSYGQLPLFDPESAQESALPAAIPDDTPAAAPTTESALHLVDSTVDTEESEASTPTQPANDQDRDTTDTPPATSKARSFKPSNYYNAGDDWTYSVVTCDTTAVYLPDDTALNLDEDHLRTLADVAELADTLGVGHKVGPGQIWLTKRLTDRMGLIITDEDPLPDPHTEPHKFNAAVGELLTTRGERVLADTLAAGWHIGDDHTDGTPQIQPRIRIHRDGRVFTVVLAHYATLWDPRQTGPDHHAFPLPEPDEDPDGYGGELTRRAARLTELLGHPWAASAGQMGAVILDRIRTRARHRVEEPGLIPDLGDLQGQNSLETIWSWWRLFSPRSLPELQHTPYLHRFDGRASWLVSAGGLELGYGTPAHYEANQARQYAEEHKIPFGLWRITLPSWNHALLLPPHPAIPRTDPVEHGGEPITCWVTTPTLRLLHAPDHLDLDIPVHETWIWPQQGRVLESWHKEIRAALLAARRKETEVCHHIHDEHHSTRATQAEATTWTAVGESIKSVYAGYIGRMISPATLNGARPWHHQPVWRDAIVAESRRRDYRKLVAHAEATGNYPVAAIGTDEYWYASSSPDPASVAPEIDDERLGKLRAKGDVLTLTDERAERVCGVPTEAEPHRQPTPIHMVFGGGTL